MIMLAISTSSSVASAALMVDGELFSKSAETASGTHSQTILPLVDELMATNSITPDMIDSYAVDSGPGSFTGVRIGVCIANAMAYTHGREIVPVCSLEALAFNADLPCCGNICTLIDARNDNGYSALYVGGECSLDPSAVQVNEFLKEIPPDTLFIGNGAVQYRQTIKKVCVNPRFLDDELNKLDARSVIKAANRAGGRRRGRLTEATPMYLRPSQAERKLK